jgi:hypothetical protein
MITVDDAFAQALADGTKVGLGGEVAYELRDLHVGTLAVPNTAEITQAITAATAPGITHIMINILNVEDAEIIGNVLRANPTLLGAYRQRVLFGSSYFGTVSGYSDVFGGLRGFTFGELAIPRGWKKYRGKIPTRIVKAMMSGWGDEFYLMSHVDAVRIMTDLVVKHNGNVAAVNTELDNTPQEGYFIGGVNGGVHWGGHAFPLCGDGTPLVAVDMFTL